MVQGQAIHSKEWVKKLFEDCLGRGGLGGNAPQKLENFCYLNMKNVASHEFWNCFKSNIHCMMIYFLFVFLHNLYPWQIKKYDKIREVEEGGDKMELDGLFW